MLMAEQQDGWILCTGNMKDYSLYSFAYVGGEDNFKKLVDYLSEIAEPENWSIGNDSTALLRKYVAQTFEQCNKQGKILYSKDHQWCCTNTGLLTVNGKDILLVFDRYDPGSFIKFANPDFKWHLKCVYSKSDRQYMRLFDGVPELAAYTDNYEDYYFNPQLHIEVNTDHILDDNWDRIKACVPYSKPVMKSMLLGVVEESKIRIMRNNRLVMPMYYEDEITYLMPIRIPVNNGKYVTMALALQKTDTNQYRANTIFTKDIAYQKVRLLMKPEENWLNEQ